MKTRFNQVSAIIAGPRGAGLSFVSGITLYRVKDGVVDAGVVVADDWQGKGLGRALLSRLCEQAKRAGYRALYGHILQANHDMLDLAPRLGFKDIERAEGGEVTVVRKL